LAACHRVPPGERSKGGIDTGGTICRNLAIAACGHDPSGRGRPRHRRDVPLQAPVRRLSRTRRM